MHKTKIKLHSQGFFKKFHENGLKVPDMNNCRQNKKVEQTPEQAQAEIDAAKQARLAKNARRAKRAGVG
jgi:hypothetical protein